MARGRTCPPAGARGLAAGRRACAKNCGEGVSGTDICDSRSGDLRGVLSAPSMRRTQSSPRSSTALSTTRLVLHMYCHAEAARQMRCEILTQVHDLL